MKAYKKLFRGRLGRWHYFLGNFIILFIAGIIAILYPDIQLSILFPLLISILTLPIIVRRLHDIDISGFIAPVSWLGYFSRDLFLVMVIAGFSLVLLFKKGSKDANKYGEAPKPGLKFLNAILNKETTK